MTDLLDAPAVAQAEALRAGEVSSVELVEGYLRRIEAVDDELASFRCVAAEHALEAAAAADRRRAEGGSAPFLGVPLSVKDLADTRDIATSKGLVALRDRVPAEDAAVVRRLRSAGFVLLGKTSTPALGLGCVTEPAGFPPSRNPWDRRLTPGGSSGGAAAAVAAGLCPVAHGSDGGGSIRIPASWTGLVGLKPSRGRVSSAPDPSNMLATSGPLARTVLDAASVLDVMVGVELGDAFWLPEPSVPFAQAACERPGRLRVAISFADRDVDPSRRAAVLDVARLLTDLGHEVLESDPDPRWGYLIEDHLEELGSPGLSAVVESLADTSGLDPLVSELIAATAPVSAEQHARAHASLLARARRATERFATYDVVLSPTTAHAPPRIGEHRELPVTELFVRWESYVPFTTMWNWTGSPAVSLPTGVGPDGLPLSVQLAAAPAEDALLLRLAAQLEDALGSPRLCPPDYTWSTG